MNTMDCQSSRHVYKGGVNIWPNDECVKHDEDVERGELIRGRNKTKNAKIGRNGRWLRLPFHSFDRIAFSRVADSFCRDSNFIAKPRLPWTFSLPWNQTKMKFVVVMTWIYIFFFFDFYMYGSLRPVKLPWAKDGEGNFHLLFSSLFGLKTAWLIEPIVNSLHWKRPAGDWSCPTSGQRGQHRPWQECSQRYLKMQKNKK